MGPVHYSQDPQTSFFSKIFIKNGSHGTIYTFKNYFVAVFSVFSNKRYLNKPLIHALANIRTFPSCIYKKFHFTISRVALSLYTISFYITPNIPNSFFLSLYLNILFLFFFYYFSFSLFLLSNQQPPNHSSTVRPISTTSQCHPIRPTKKFH